MSLDERWIRSLHVQAMRHAELHAGHEPHVLFQASTIGALLEGSFEGDVSLSELAEHGDLGLGTVNHLDGEMIAIDGRVEVSARDRIVVSPGVDLFVLDLDTDPPPLINDTVSA